MKKTYKKIFSYSISSVLIFIFSSNQLISKEILSKINLQNTYGDNKSLNHCQEIEYEKSLFLHPKNFSSDFILEVQFESQRAWRKSLLEGLIESEKKTSRNKRLQINLALNYGSKYELINAFKSLQKNKKQISEKNICKYLLTKNIPDPDILIRTGNTKRLSNFLLWQLAYSEIFFEKKLWPDFNEKDYNKIINKFKKIKRNYGNI